LDERGSETAFYHLTAAGVYTPIRPANGIIHSQVLPDFQFRLNDLYHLPEPPQLVVAPIYNHYTSPYLRAERERAEEAIRQVERATQQAAEERRRAEQERARSEQYAARLRALGVDPDAI
jgi:hypothetical protein